MVFCEQAITIYCNLYMVKLQSTSSIVAEIATYVCIASLLHVPKTDN